MDYLKFIESTKENRLHSVSGDELVGNITVDEPCYLLTTSGGTSRKSYIHSLERIQSSVESFLEQFPLSKENRWGLCLSTKHIAGFSILARSYFAGFKEPFIFDWSVERVVETLVENEITVLSLVPTQVFDLIKINAHAPPKIKCVFVGGAFLSRDILNAAKNLGWPIVQCYGSTETFAQMAYSTDEGVYKPFPNWSVSQNENGDLLLSGPSLFLGTLESNELVLNTEETFNTKDLVEFVGEGFKILGKSNGLVKIKGSYFDMNTFKENFREELSKSGLSERSCFPVLLEEVRNGAGLYLIGVSISIEEGDVLLEKFSEFRGFFKISDNVFSEIGKVDRVKLEGVLSKPVVCL